MTEPGGLFSGTADSYRRFRSRVPEEAARLLAAAAPTAAGGPRRLLDLGTGPGFVVSAVGPAFDEVLAVDPDPDLLAVARTDLAALPALAGVDVRLQEGRAEEVVVPAGWQAHLVTVCRAFHWMDQPRVLARLDEVVAPDGVVAVMGDSSIWSSDDPWKRRVRELVQEFLGTERRAGTGTYRRHDRTFAEVLGDSPFGRVEEHRVDAVAGRTVASVIGYLHSTSFAAPRLFGDRLAEFDAAVGEALTPYLEDGRVQDRNVFEVLLARR